MKSDLPSCCEGIFRILFTSVHENRPHLNLRGNLVSFRLVAGTVGFLLNSIGETGLLLRCKGKVRIPLESNQGNRH